MFAIVIINCLDFMEKGSGLTSMACTNVKLNTCYLQDFFAVSLSYTKKGFCPYLCRMKGKFSKRRRLDDESLDDTSSTNRSKARFLGAQLSGGGNPMRGIIQSNSYPFLL